MTNREWIQSLTNEELAKWLCETQSQLIGWKETTLATGDRMQLAEYDRLYPRLHELTSRYSDSTLGLAQWLGEERKHE